MVVVAGKGRSRAVGEWWFKHGKSGSNGGGLWEGLVAAEEVVAGGG